MTRYIDKDALAAEIRNKVDSYKGDGIISIGVLKQQCEDFIYSLDKLEVKEVDLEKEIQDHIRGCLDIKFPTTDIELIKKDVEYTSRKFFELGLKAQKGERV